MPILDALISFANSNPYIATFLSIWATVFALSTKPTWESPNWRRRIGVLFRRDRVFVSYRKLLASILLALDSFLDQSDRGSSLLEKKASIRETLLLWCLVGSFAYPLIGYLFSWGILDREMPYGLQLFSKSDQISHFTVSIIFISVLLTLLYFSLQLIGSVLADAHEPGLRSSTLRRSLIFSSVAIFIYFFLRYLFPNQIDQVTAPLTLIPESLIFLVGSFLVGFTVAQQQKKVYAATISVTLFLPPIFLLSYFSFAGILFYDEGANLIAPNALFSLSVPGIMLLVYFAIITFISTLENSTSRTYFLLVVIFFSTIAQASLMILLPVEVDVGAGIGISVLFVFFIALPLLNFITDYCSISITRVLLRRASLAKSRSAALLYCAADLILAVSLLILAGVAFFLIFDFLSLNQSINSISPYSLFELFYDSVYREDFIWLAVILATTLLPTMIHLFLGVLAVGVIWPSAIMKRIGLAINGEKIDFLVGWVFVTLVFSTIATFFVFIFEIIGVSFSVLIIDYSDIVFWLYGLQFI